MKALFDTNILIDYLLGVNNARLEIERYKNPQISIITKIEILVGADKNNEEEIRGFLDNFVVIPLNDEIADIAASIRKEQKIKLPDAIIWASAKYAGSLLVTRNVKVFPIDVADVKIPYKIEHSN